MHLLGSAFSPFVRKIRVVAAELGVADPLEITVFDPHSAPADLVAANPLSKVPTLVTDDGMVLTDSRVIAEWLDATYGPKLMPRESPARWRVATTAAIADGLLDAGGLVRLERLRPQSEQSPAWIDKQMGKIIRTLDRWEADTGWRRGTEPDLGTIGIGCAVGWVEFRMPELQILDTRPGLAAWYAGFAARPSMVATVPRQAA